jgi:hypothetical protein
VYLSIKNWFLERKPVNYSDMTKPAGTLTTSAPPENINDDEAVIRLGMADVRQGKVTRVDMTDTKAVAKYFLKQ